MQIWGAVPIIGMQILFAALHIFHVIFYLIIRENKKQTAPRFFYIFWVFDMGNQTYF